MKKIKIANSRLAATVRTDSAVTAFENAVENGQTRLALDILSDMLPSIINRLEEVEELILPTEDLIDPPTVSESEVVLEKSKASTQSNDIITNDNVKSEEIQQSKPSTKATKPKEAITES